jgi:peroxiredoxin
MKPPSIGVRRALASICVGAAVLIVIAAGLPSRAAYTGQFIAGEGFAAPEIGASAPDFSTMRLSGEPFVLSQTRGTPIILNFWATWCVPCEIEMPELQALHVAHPSIRVIGVNLSESPAVIADWMARGGFTFDIALDPAGQIASLYALRGQPTTFILSPSGVILEILYGATTRAALEDILAPYLG